jgi:peptide/nickel transport system ATP-binding protein
VARCIIRLIDPTAGEIRLHGVDIAKMSAAELRPLRRRVQIVFQDPYRSLNPRRTVLEAVIEGPVNYGVARAQAIERARQLMELVRMDPASLSRYPHQFSGGQRQRICIARALAQEPELLIADEAVSALDVSVQAQVLNILADLKARFGLTYVFISHDLSVVESVSDRVAVMYFGHVAEIGPAAEVFARPMHPYTRLLLNSAAAPGKRSLIPEDADTELPDPYDPPPGCPFYARCPRHADICRSAFPPFAAAHHEARHEAACYYPQDSGPAA